MAPQGLAQEAFMSTEDVGDVLVEVIGTALAFPAVGFEEVLRRAPSGILART